jgi:hypothetical protein
MVSRVIDLEDHISGGANRDGPARPPQRPGCRGQRHGRGLFAFALGAHLTSTLSFCLLIMSASSIARDLGASPWHAL